MSCCLACLFVYHPLCSSWETEREQSERERCALPFNQKQTEGYVEEGGFFFSLESLEYVVVVCARFALCGLSFACAFSHFAVGSLVEMICRFCCCSHSVYSCATVHRTMLTSRSRMTFHCLSPLLSPLLCTLATSVLFSLDQRPIFFEFFLPPQSTQTSGNAQSYRVKEVARLVTLFICFLYYSSSPSFTLSCLFVCVEACVYVCCLKKGSHKGE